MSLLNDALLPERGDLEVPVHLRAVSYKWFMAWSKRHAGLRGGCSKCCHPPTYCLLDVVKAASAEHTSSFWAVLPKEARREGADIFVSHAWGQPLSATRRALRNWHNSRWIYDLGREKNEKKGWCCLKPSRRDPSIWFDVIAINQHPGKKNAEDVEKLGETLGSIGRLVLCSDTSLSPLSRSWCLFELVTAFQTNARIDISVNRRTPSLRRFFAFALFAGLVFLDVWMMGFLGPENQNNTLRQSLLITTTFLTTTLCRDHLHLFVLL